MRHGMSGRPQTGGAEFQQRYVEAGPFDLNFYALRKDGAYAGAALWSGRIRSEKLVPSQFSVNDGGLSRHEPCVFLLERKQG